MPGDQVAERLLRRETDDDRRDRAADGERGRVEAGDAQREQHRRRDHHEPDQEADGAGGRRIHAPEQRGPTTRPMSRASAQPRTTSHGGGDPHRRVRAEQLLAAEVGVGP